MTRKTALDASEGTLDSDERDFVRAIRQYGWHRMSVVADEDGPGFSYTTGFSLLPDVPEFIVFSLAAETAGDILWDIYRESEGSRRFPLGVRIPDMLGSGSAVLMPVAKRHYADYLGWSHWFYDGDDFPCVQLVWPDRTGQFPWEEGFAQEFANLQPDLTERGWRAHLI
jgi:hypothetical protein